MESAPNMKQPKGLIVLFLTEMWERFSYYGMRALLVLYLIQELFTFEGSKTVAYGIFAAYGSLMYASPFIGGMIADKYLGYRKAVILGAILMAIGHFAMVVEQESFLYIALAFLILGGGFFKPNMPLILSGLYTKNDPRRDGGFTLYYMSVNLGAFFSPIVCGIIGETYGWHYGFGIAGIGMLAGLFIFVKYGHLLDYQDTIESETGEKISVYKPLGQVPNPEQLRVKYLGITQEWWLYIACFVAVFGVAFLVKNYEIMSFVIFPLTLVILGVIVFIAIESPKIERDRLFVILILLLFTTLFFSFFEQAGSSLTLFASENVNRKFADSIIPASLFQSINPLFILIFASPLSFLWMRLATRKKEPSTSIKFAIGILLLSFSFLLLGITPYFYSFQSFTEGDTLLHVAAVPAIFLVFSYLLSTLGELCLSPIGLSMVTRLAPAKISGMVLGAWYLSSSLAFQVGGWIANLTTEDEQIYEMEIAEGTSYTMPTDSVHYEQVLRETYSQKVLQKAVDNKIVTEDILQSISDEERDSFINLIRYTNVFWRLGVIAFVASILLFILSPFITKMMHEERGDKC